jgi:ubiquinone/menaquinone biosynthesis C-methylase UbiE
MERPFAEIDDQTRISRTGVVSYLDMLAQSPLFQRTRSVARDAWRLDRPHRLLDVGAGIGEVARGLVPLVGEDGEVVALDNSQTMLDAAQRDGHGGPVRYVLGDVRSLPYADGYFDGVRSERVLQHLDDPDAAIREMARVLRPGGRLCLVDTDWDSVVVDGSPDELPEVLDSVLKSFSLTTRMGRTLRRRLVAAGLTDAETTPVTMATTSRAEASVITPIFSREALARMAQSGPVEASERLLKLADQAEADGTFLFALTIWVATATKR